jgi:TolB-like protein
MMKNSSARRGILNPAEVSTQRATLGAMPPAPGGAGTLARRGAFTVLAALSLALGACSVIDTSSAPHLAAADTVAILPITNNTETPQAGLRAASIAESVLITGGLSHVRRYPVSADDETLFDTARPDGRQKALDWARDEHIRYALSGAVNEWRYKVGVDGEPAVGLSFQLIDVQSGAVVWSGAGSRSGWSRDALSGVAQKLERQLLAPLASAH